MNTASQKTQIIRLLKRERKVEDVLRTIKHYGKSHLSVICEFVISLINNDNNTERIKHIYEETCSLEKSISRDTLMHSLSFLDSFEILNLCQISKYFKSVIYQCITNNKSLWIQFLLNF